MRHFLTTQDWSRAALQALLDRARHFRRSPRADVLAGKTIALVFLNPSLRTRASFQVGAYHLGGQAIVLEPGGGAWPMEFSLGAVMDGSAEEHAKEAAQVLSRYCDLIGVRAFPKFQNWEIDREDPVLSAFARWSRVPVINMETIVHPCQELALMMALQDRLGETDGKKFTLTWAPHPRALNTAVANSALMIAAKFGFEITLLVPHPAYELDPRYMAAARGFAAEHGRSVTVTTDIEEGYAGAQAVYVKSWGALDFFGRWPDEEALRGSVGARGFLVDERKMALTANAVVSHCLPMRRNVKIADAVADSAAFLGIEEAENRLHVQKAIMARLVEG